uniref:Uncharacterized protein n=1 Tax=Arundo donax TaxID=35708 RepID=A0A0A9MGD5_ARUDO
MSRRASIFRPWCFHLQAAPVKIRGLTPISLIVAVLSSPAASATHRTASRHCCRRWRRFLLLGGGPPRGWRRLARHHRRPGWRGTGAHRYHAAGTSRRRSDGATTMD